MLTKKTFIMQRFQGYLNLFDGDQVLPKIGKWIEDDIELRNDNCFSVFHADDVDFSHIDPFDSLVPLSCKNDFLIPEVTPYINDYIEDFSDESFDHLEDIDNFSFNEEFTDVKRNAVVRYNCKWTGCDEDCAKSHKLVETSFEDSFDNFGYESSDVFGQVILPSQLYDLEYYSDDNSSDCRTLEDIMQPYTPDNDHSYSQRRYSPPASVESNETARDFDSETVSETSDSEVDVVTITEDSGYQDTAKYIVELCREVARPKRNVRRQPARRGKKAAATAAKIKTDSTIKRAAAALKRTKKQQRLTAAKKRKMNSVETTPSSSLPSSNVTSLCGSDNEDLDKRNTHNNLERRRREVQRDHLQSLRQCIPLLVHKPKTPKVVILRHAEDHFKELLAEGVRLENEVSNERLKNKQLRAKLETLRKCIKF